MATWTLNYTNSYQNDWSITFCGDQGTLAIDNEGYRVWKEPWPKNQQPVSLVVDRQGDNEGYRVWKEPWPKNQQPVQTFEAPVPIESHIQNFLDCVKSRKEPNAPVEVGASAVSAPHLANVAFHHDRRMYLSADASRATDHPEA